MAIIFMPPTILAFKLPEYDRLYEQSLKLADSPERDLLYRKMSRLLEFYAPVQFMSTLPNGCGTTSSN